METLALDVPSPEPGQVLVRTVRSLISAGTELTLLHASATGERWGDLTHYPKLAGYSNVGRVEAVGEGVDPGWIGRTVHNHGGHQRFALSPEDRVAALPEGVSPEEAVFATLGKVAMNGLRRAAVTWGETVGVVGLGVLGQLVCRLCLRIGVRRIYAFEVTPARMARLPPSQRLIGFPGDLRDREVRRRFRDRHGASGVDVMIEATGEPTVLAAAPRLVRRQGRFLLLSSPRGPSHFDFHDLCNRPSLTILGAHGFSHPAEGSLDDRWTSRRHGELFLEMLAQGELTTRELITHRLRAADAACGYRGLSDDPAGTLGVVLQW
ncbi:MAG: zinc-binding alcohol dehydrogenase [Thermoanaerobaculia bacterium]|nr:zinc-binding alcohol dehydrogenase [Thermoanaerobaculia bacterium]